MAIESSISPARSGHVVIGVDTHKHVHVTAVLDPIGGVLGTLTIATDMGGFRQLLSWATSFGQIIAPVISVVDSDTAVSFRIRPDSTHRYSDSPTFGPTESRQHVRRCAETSPAQGSST
jgi:hypothetical protein